MEKKPVLVIMAAGMGSRYGGLKQMDPIGSGGELIIDFSLYDAWRAGFETAICIIKKEIETDFKAIMDRGAARRMNLLYAYQEIDAVPEGTRIPKDRNKPWGTGHALLQAKPLIDGPFAVINADDYYGRDAFVSAYNYLSRAEDQDLYDYCMIGYSIENTLTENGHVARGVCALTPEGYLSDIKERKKIQRNQGQIQFTLDDEKWTTLAEGTPVSMNFFGFTPSFLEELEQRFPIVLEELLKTDPIKGEFYIPLVVGDLIEEQRASVKVIPSRDKWYGVTYKEDKPLVMTAMEAKKKAAEYPASLWEDAAPFERNTKA
ncbi:MAG TPA: nucleotidyltransferase [Clostridiales bacterium]|nr:nucleotidyltransferase [Clostridiales bacterium]